MKTQISAEIIADSVNPAGERITSFILTFPRFILAELNTHRAFSRNSASSRAIPFKKMLEKVQNDPFIPIAWQKEHTGMQGTEYFTDSEDIEVNEAMWRTARNEAVRVARFMDTDKVTKQLTNRLLEPFLWHRVLVTATDFENFFELRCPQYRDGSKTFRSKKDVLSYNFHELKANRDVIDFLDNRSLLDWLQVNESGAEIHIGQLAECMWDAYNESTPKLLHHGEWHIPFGDNISSEYSLEAKLKIATARCARTSYDNFEGTTDFEKDTKLYDTLFSSKHMSPFEHCAQSQSGAHSRNFKGFVQYREIIEYVWQSV